MLVINSDGTVSSKRQFDKEVENNVASVNERMFDVQARKKYKKPKVKKEVKQPLPVSVKKQRKEAKKINKKYNEVVAKLHAEEVL